MKYIEAAKLIDYDSITGSVTWRERPLSEFKHERFGKSWNRRFAGQPAGYEFIRCYPGTWEESYVSMRLEHKKKVFPLSKLLWVKMTGEFPEGRVKFRNGDPRDLRWANMYVGDPVSFF